MSEAERSFDVAVVGGGAAGLATAIFAARSEPSLKVAILDGARKLGAKILVSGGGRCNVTNVKVTPQDFQSSHPRIAAKVLAAFSETRTVEFFRALGVDLHEEENGKLFPNTHSAGTVLSALMRESERLGVTILTENRVASIRRINESVFQLDLQTGHRIVAKSVVLACGGISLPKTGSDGGGYALAQSLGHSLTPPTPALASLVLDGTFHASLSGVALPVELSLHVEGERPVRIRGAMLWTHFGISGPAALDVSRFWTRAILHNRKARLTANFLPGRDFQSVDTELQDYASRQPRSHLVNVLISLIPTQQARAMLQSLTIDPATPMAHLSKDHRRRLVHALIEWPLLVLRDRGFNHAEVTAGGIPLDEIDPANMHSRKCPNLYLVGEMLDVDGRLGGFNFQWAWSSGYVAGVSLARSFQSDPSKRAATSRLEQ